MIASILDLRVFQKFRTGWKWLTEHSIDGRIVSAYRILFALTGILIFGNMLSQFELLYGGQWLFRIYLILAIGLNVLILINKTNWVVQLAQYALAVYLLNATSGVYNVEPKFHVIASFWCIFIPFRTMQLRKVNSGPGWPVILFFFNVLAYVFFGGAVTKLFDPLWMHGKGLFYTFSLPWIGSPLMANLFNEEILYYFNYFSMGVEILAFPLVLFKRTRMAGFILFLFFAGFLMFGVSIQMIGWQALSMSVLFLGIFIRNTSNDATWVSKRKAKGIKVLIGFMALTIGHSIYEISTYTYPVYDPDSPFIYKESNSENAQNAGFGNYLENTYQYVNRRSLHIRTDILFTGHHTVGVYAYKVFLKSDDGSTEEPFQVFKEDMSADMLSSSIIASRWLQADMYRYSKYANSVNRDTVLTKVPYWIRNVSRYAVSQTDAEDWQEMEVFVSPIVQEKGEVKWQKLLSFDFEQDELQLFTINRQPTIIELGGSRQLIFDPDK